LIVIFRIFTDILGISRNLVLPSEMAEKTRVKFDCNFCK